MQFVTLANGIDSEKSEHKITHAILRDDGKICFQIDGKTNSALEDPTGVVQIALTADGLWCCDEKGKLYRLENTPNCDWEQDASIKDVTSIGAIPDGRLCAINRHGKTLVRVPTDQEGFVWQTDSEIATYLRPVKKVKRPPLRFGIRTLLLIFTAIAMILGPWAGMRRANDQREAVELLERIGCNIKYAHQFNDDNEFIDAAPEPGPEWIRGILGKLSLIHI